MKYKGIVGLLVACIIVTGAITSWAAVPGIGGAGPVTQSVGLKAIRVRAANITEIPTSKLQSTTLKKYAHRAEELVDHGDYPMYSTENWAEVRAYAVKRKRNSRQTVNKMMRQLVHRTTKFRIESKNLEVEKITTNGRSMHMAILDSFLLEFYDEDMTEIYSNLMWDYIDDLSKKATSSKNVVLYRVRYFNDGTNGKMGFDGRGIIIYKKDRNEVLRIDIHATENDY